jgi:hypothetical protein
MGVLEFAAGLLAMCALWSTVYDLLGESHVDAD